VQNAGGDIDIHVARVSLEAVLQTRLRVIFRRV
jgi:hypothetical protein